MNVKKRGSAKELEVFLKKSYEKYSGVGEILNFFDSSLEDRLMPKEKIWLYVNEVMDTPWAFNYSNPQGGEGLRTKLADWYLNSEKLKGNFMITSGAQEALVVIIQYLSKLIGKKLKVGVEEFSYIGFRHILEEWGSEMRFLKLTSEGLELDILERELKKGLDLVYLIPDLQNPTGVVYSEENRKRIAELQQKYNFWLILDLSYRDLFFNEADKPSIQMFNHERTFLVGSFSKTVFPALRIGWLYMPKIDNKLLLVRRSIDLFQPTFLQLAMEKYLVNDYADHLRIVRSIMVNKKDQLIRALKENGFDNSFRWSDVLGGYYLWLRRIDGKNCETEINRWVKDGVVVASGVFFNPNAGANDIRLCFSRLSLKQIREAVERMSGGKNRRKRNLSTFFLEILANGKTWFNSKND